MRESLLFKPPEVTDDDIYMASDILGLQPDAFYGVDGTDSRQEVLKSMESLDIAACPGSGKTTLLVAKLAILAAKWQYRTRGICVLSHTNAARSEVEKKLGNSVAGRRLLSYPHYIGTIHGFVNEFIACPLLRSLGYNGVRFNTDITGYRIWKLSGYGRNLPGYIYTKVKNKEHRKSAICGVHYVGENRDLHFNLPNSSFTLHRNSSSTAFNQIDDWKSVVLQEGYAAYEDIFAYGYLALKHYPYLADTLRGRFPLLFIDEAQDNSDEQSAILQRIFIEGNSRVLRQRFGDDNQAIYHSVRDTEAMVYAFPDPGIKKQNLANSYRFGNIIASLADPLGLIPFHSGLRGQGPKENLLLPGVQEGQHTIFLFNDDCDACKVLDAYGELLVKTFTKSALNKKEAFWAVGQVHRPSDEDNDRKHPRHIGHYWPNYNPELTRSDPQPQAFVQYVFAGQCKSETTGETHFAVEKIAEGILRLAEILNDGITCSYHGNCHRYVLRLIEKCTDVRECYQDFVTTFAVDRIILTEDTWGRYWKDAVCNIAMTVAGTSRISAEARDFLEWKPGIGLLGLASCVWKATNNIYRYPSDNPEVNIHLGSIHSIKGQTHTATLVLETHWNDYNLSKLVPWIAGPKRGWMKTDGVEQKKRLKVHYVAMTRPTHLLCLAMKRSAFDDGNGGIDSQVRRDLEQRGWHVKCV